MCETKIVIDKHCIELTRTNCLKGIEHKRKTDTVILQNYGKFYLDIE